MFRFLTKIFILVLAAAPGWGQQTVWFTPLPYTTHPVGTFGSTDYMSLFSPTAPWQQAAAHVQVFKIYGVDNFSDADLSTLLANLKQRHIALALEWPVLSSSTCGAGIEGFGGSFLSVAQRIQLLGGTLAYVAMEQPYQWGSLYTGANACQWTAQQVAANALLAINEAKTIFPDLMVGDISAVPPFQNLTSAWTAQYGAWLDAWRAATGAPLAFFHADVDWTVPNWQAAVAALRPAVEQRGVPFGIVYNGFLTDQTDTAWMSDAESHFVDYEVWSGYAPPEQVNFQSWNPNPTHVLPETDPTAFTYLIDRYLRTRTQLILTDNGTQLGGKLTAGSAAVAGATIQLTSQATSGSGTIYSYIITGTVPTNARTAVVGARINSECYSCNGPADLTVYAFQYSDSQGATGTWNFNNGLNGWGYGPTPVFDFGSGGPYFQGLHITAQTGQAISLNSYGVAVSPGAQFTMQVTARVSPLSVGSGYFTLIWFDASGNEPSRETLMLQPPAQTLGTLTTAGDGSFTWFGAVNLASNKVTASFAGNTTLWPATASLPENVVPPPSIVSLTPFAGSGAAATFSVVFSNPAGWAAVADAQVLINSGLSPAAGCSISYLPASGTFQLMNDAGTAWSSTVLSNSQCSLAGASATGSGNNLTLTLPVSFQAGFASPTAEKTVFLQVTDSQGRVAVWTPMGSWFPVIGPPNPAGACSLAVTPAAAAVPPTGGTLTLALSGGACGWAASSNVAWLSSPAVSTTGATLTITAAPNTTGSQRIGTLTLGGQTVPVTQAVNNPLQIPALVSLNPFQGTGPNAALTLVYSHPSGWAAIQSAEFIVNPRWEPTDRSGGCYVKYAPNTGSFTLIADDGSSIAGTTAPGSGGAVSNSQCTLEGSSSSVTGSGTTLTVVVSLSFQPSFSGQRHIWMQAVDYNNLSTNWLVYGVWFPTATSVNAIPWYRIYDPNSKSFLYSADPNEYNTLGLEGFVQQGISGLVMDSPTTVGGISNIAWYRVYVNATSSHFWTSDRTEFLTLVNQQQAYVGEGVAAFVMPYINAGGQVSPQVTNTIPFYRAAFQGANLHFWTSDPNEFFGTNGERLPAGYVGEGIACYIFPAGGAKFSGALTVLTDEDDPAPAVVSVANAASYVRSSLIVPGQVLSIFVRHPEGTVLLNGLPAEIVSRGDKEIRVLAPPDFAGASEVSLQVEHRGHGSPPVKLTVVSADPAILSSNAYGRGQAQARNQDGSMNNQENPAARGSLVTLFTAGYTDRSQPLEVHIAGRPAAIVSVQPAATRAGVIEVQVRVPGLVEPAPFQPVVLRLGNLFSQPGIGLAIR